MKKAKLLFLMIFSLVLLNFGVVKATELLPDDAARVMSTELKQLKTGTAPWDADDTPGNDSSATNLVVRSFDQVIWTVENTMEIQDGAEKYTGGRLYFEVTVPEGFTSETFKWDLEAMNWVENAKLSEDGMTLTGYYSMKTNDTTVPGKQNLIFNGKVLGAKNGTELKPIFKTWLNGNTEDEICENSYDAITVSSAPNYNVKLTRNTQCQNRTSIEVDGETIKGRMYSYVTIFQLYNTNISKGMRGVEYPNGDFSVDLDMTLYQKINGQNVDISDKIQPILWNYYIAGLGNDQKNAMIPENLIYQGTTGYVVHGSSITPNGYLTTNRDNCIFDSGVPKMTQDGSTLHLSISDYKFDGTFPRVTRDGGKNTATNYTENVGCFSSIFFQIFIPDFDEYDASATYYFYVEDKNMQATSLSDVVTGNQNVNNDDTTNVQYIKTPPGSYSNYVFIHKRNGNSFTGSYTASEWGAGDARLYRGQEINICSQFTQSATNDPDVYPHTINNFLKFDGDCYQPVITPNGTQYVSEPNTANKMKFNLWYATKPDGSNWSSAQEMNSAEVTQMVLYKNLDEVPEGDIIVGVWMESYEGYMDMTYVNVRIPCVVKSTAGINDTFGITQIPTYWTEELDRDIYTIENPDVEWPKQVYQSKRNYIKSEFDAAGALITGTHYNGVSWGNTAQVVGAQQSIQISAIDPDNTKNKKINYDMSKNEYDVLYKMEPIITNPINVNFGETDVTVNVYAYLPAAMTYVPGSSNMGDPDLEKQADGTTKLTWTIYGTTVNDQIEPITFKGHINEESSNGDQLTVDCEIDADPTKIGTTRKAARIANTTVQIIDLAAHRLYKTVSTPVIEQNGQIHYSIAYKNNTDTEIPDFQMLDILPYIGDGRGTDYNGTTLVSKLVVTQKDENGETIPNDNLTLSYTEGEDGKTATAKDVGLGDNWTVATSETINKNITAFCCKGVVGSQGLVNIDIYIDTNGNKGGDTYVNSGSTQVYSNTNAINTSEVTVTVVSRSLDGIVWYDLNNDGIMDDDEPRAKNIKITLTDKDGNLPEDVDGNIVSEVNTDENGYYQFVNLKAMDYYVTILMPEARYSITEKLVGPKSTVNSKFNQEEEATDLITKLNSLALPNLVVSNQNCGLVKKPTNVIVNYKEVGTEEVLAEMVEITGRADDDYATENKLDEINEEYNNKYNFVKVDGDEEGVMLPETIYVTYWYQKKPTHIVIKHLDIDTQEVLWEETEEYGNIDDEYETHDELANINDKFEGIYKYIKVDGDAKGQMEKDVKTITYYYQVKDGEIEVNYVEFETGNVLASQETSSDRIGKPYTTVDKIEEINTTHDVVYELINIEGNVTGEYKLDKQVITYIYDKKGAKVVTKYVDIDTDEELYEMNVNKGTIGQDYTTVNELDNINVIYDNAYEFVKVTDNATGKMTEDTIYVTYYYQRKMGEIEVNYKEVGSEVVLADQITSTEKVGTDYTTASKLDEINEKYDGNYEFVKVDGKTEGKYGLEKQVITYWYQRKVTEVIVNYVEVDTNKTLYQEIKFNGKVNDPYETVDKVEEINKVFNPYIYELVTIEGDKEGEMESATKYITYYYKKKTKEVVIVQRDEFGNVLGEETIEVVIGEDFEVIPEEKEGYETETEIVINPETGKEEVIIHYVKKDDPSKDPTKPVDTSDMNVALVLGVMGLSLVGLKKVKFAKNK